MRTSLLVGAMLVPLLSAGCGRGPAESALLAADEAILRVKPAAEKYVPDEFGALVARAAQARTAYDRGDYGVAREIAASVLPQAEQVLLAAAANKELMTAQWNEQRDVLPELLSLVTGKLSVLASMRRPPTFIAPAEAEAAVRGLTEANVSWSAAIKAFNDGDLPDAVTKADAARATVNELAVLLEPVVLPPSGVR